MSRRRRKGHVALRGRFRARVARVQRRPTRLDSGRSFSRSSSDGYRREDSGSISRVRDVRLVRERLGDSLVSPDVRRGSRVSRLRKSYLSERDAQVRERDIKKRLDRFQICRRRSERREVLAALGKFGRQGHGAYHYDERSNVTCGKR